MIVVAAVVVVFKNAAGRYLGFSSSTNINDRVAEICAKFQRNRFSGCGILHFSIFQHGGQQLPESHNLYK